MEFKDYIVQTCNEMAKFLINKNKRYGNSVVRPLHVFSWLPPEEQIKARIDDKIKRIRYGQRSGREDTVKDLTGYLILLLAYRSYMKDAGKKEEKEIRELVERAKRKELVVADEPVRPYEYYVARIDAHGPSPRYISNERR